MIVVVVLTALSAAVYIQVRQHALRTRAEKLLTDIRNLQLSRGTVADIQSVVKAWEKAGTVETKCGAQTCRYDISIDDRVWFPRNAIGRAVVLLYLTVGWHAGAAGASIETRNETIEHTEFRLMLIVPPYVSKIDPEGYGLFGRAGQQAEFPSFDFWPQRMLHPDYFIGKPGGCEGCIKLMTFSVPRAQPAKIAELTDFNLSCITRWVPCTTEADLMPSAWKQYQAELAQEDALTKAWDACSFPLELLGREITDIAVADVISRGAGSAKGADFKARLRITRILKGQSDWPLNEIVASRVFDRGPILSGSNSNDMAPGKRYIVLGSFASDPSGNKVLALDGCGLIPFTDQNFSAVRRGFETDINSTAPKN
jgi:hypothetical protein